MLLHLDFQFENINSCLINSVKERELVSNYEMTQNKGVSCLTNKKFKHSLKNKKE